MPSVLVGEFGPVMRVGLVEVLAGGRIDCVGEDRAGEDCAGREPQAGDLLARLDETVPDAVVINWDDRRSEAVMASLHTRRPEITVIACSSNRLAMLVRPGRASDRGTYELRLSADGLVEAVRSASVQ